MKIVFACIFLFISVVTQQVRGHGMLWDPPNRSSMWRFGYDVPANYDDNQNYCGGVGVQHQQNGGKCGFCGDPYQVPTPRPNENGGTYGTGTISGTYKSGSVIPIVVRLTAAHLGYFEFSICNLDNDPKESDECYKPVALENGSYQYGNIDGPHDFNIRLKLPDGLKCKQCSLRWHYHTGNSYGDCGDGTSAVGCGPQETFRSCSDIKIE